MSYEELSDDTPLVVEPKEGGELTINTSLDQVKTALAELKRIEDNMANLAKEFPSDLVYDVATTRGMAEAVAHRAAWRDPRLSAEKYRKTAKAPVLTLGRAIDAKAASLIGRLHIGEDAVDDQIQAELTRKEEIKKAKIAAEFGRITAMQEAIGEIGMDAVIASSKPSTHIRSAMFNIREQPLDPAVFQEMMPQAIAARDAAVAKLEIALSAKLHEEAEAEKAAVERAELEALRKAAAEQKLKDEAAAAEARKAEDARAAVERKAAQEEQKRLDAEAAAARAEQDRVAAEARRVAQAAHESAMRKEREDAAEAKRAADDKAAKALAKQRKAEAADKMVRDAANTMLAALRDIQKMEIPDAAQNICAAAIKEATGE